MSIRSINKVLNQLIINTSKEFSNNKRLYSRWSHRQPSRVILPFEPKTTSLKNERVIELTPEPSVITAKISSGNKPFESVDKTDQKQLENVSDETLEKFENTRAKRDEKIKKMKMSINQLKVFDENNEIIYEKCKDNDGRISSLLVKLKSKKDRQRSGLVLVEGWRLITAGLEAKCSLKYVMFSRTEDLINLRPFLPKTGVKIFKIPYKEIELWSSVETSPGIFGVFESPTAENIKRLSRPFPLQIICDNIRIPGNLGAILRAAAGMGCQNVLLSKGCVDFWDPKVVRSAAGAHFTLPVHFGLDWEAIKSHVDQDTAVFVADSNAMASGEDDEGTDSRLPVAPYYGVDYVAMKKIALVVGGETEGISADSYRFASSRGGLRLNIPLARGVDSLNTGMAAAVIAFEVKKQLLQAWTKIAAEKKMMNSV